MSCWPCGITLARCTGGCEPFAPPAVAGNGGAAVASAAVENDERLAFYGHVALNYLHVAGECRNFLFVANFKRRRLDLNRLLLIFGSGVGDRRGRSRRTRGGMTVLCRRPCRREQ
jgi:hypothetical protein